MTEVREILVPHAKLVVEGKGTGHLPIVLLHGVAGDRRIWDWLWDDLTERAHVLRYDLRGCGGSLALDEAEYRPADDLAGLLDALGVALCDLVGISLGGSIALNFSLDHPDRVRRLALLSPAMTAWEWSQEWRVRWRAMVKAARAGDIEGARRLWWEHPLFSTTRAMPAPAEKFKQSLWSYSGSIWIDGDREASARPDLDRLHLLNIPTLLLTGSEDLADFRLIADLIEAAVPDVRRVDYCGAGHLLNLERPKEIAAELLKFLD